MRLEQKASQQIRNVKAAFKRILLLAERVKNMNGNIELAISIVFTLFTGGLMMLVYRFCHDALTYNRRFNITLLMLAFVSTILLTLIQDNPMLSLGVLGSLSICRIRTNTKDPRDLGFVFLEPVQEMLGQAQGSSVQSKNVFADTFELVYKVRVEEKEEENLLCKISKMEGIHGVNILSPKTKVA